MITVSAFWARILSFFVLASALGFSTICAQDETLAEIQYKEDYDRVQKIIKVSPPAKRAIQLLELFEARSNMDSRLRAYVDNIFATDLESLMRQSDYNALLKFCERALKVRPKFGEAYFFYAVALKREKRMNEAMDALAKCYVIPNPFQKKAKQLLDITYRDLNKGSLVGEDKIIDKAKKEIM